jgi:hypothetical protein
MCPKNNEHELNIFFEHSVIEGHEIVALSTEENSR